MNTKNLLMLQIVLLLGLVLLVAVGIALPYILPIQRSDSNSSNTKWQYLTLNYSQGNSFDNDYPLYELISADVEPYASQFPAILNEGCSGSGEFSGQTLCIARNFKGREFFLTSLGSDGWELIQMDNQSSQYSYSVEMLFKRPVS